MTAPISVIVPCRNAAPWLAVTLRTLLQQTCRPAEIIVVDDGSDDGSAEIARGFAPAVKVLEGPRRGASAARLAGLAAARDDTALMFCDADDLLAPDTLAALAAVLNDNPDAIALAPWQRFQEASKDVWVAAPPSCKPRGDLDDLSAWLSGWYHPPCAVLWSRIAYDRSGGWDPDATVNDDGDVMMRGLARGNRLVLSGVGTAFYRRLPEGGSLSGSRATAEGLTARLTVLDRIAGLLDKQGRLARYASPLATAYGFVAQDAKGSAPDLAVKAQTAIAALPSGRRRAPKTPLPTHNGLPRPTGGEDWRPTSDNGEFPAVSVVVPTYNRAGTLPRALKSVLNQDFTDFELIVVDDGSTDDTTAAVKELDDPRIRYIQQDNAGVATARNTGIRAARAEFIALLDSDDEWLPGKLGAEVAALRAAPARTGFVLSLIHI